MKKWIVMLLCFCITWSATACGQTNSSVDSQESTAPTEQQEESASDETITESDLAEAQATEESETASTNATDETGSSSHILVAYFSCTGNTATLAEYVAEITGANLYEIIPEEPYSNDDLNYSVDDCRANLEQNDSSCRPAIDGEIENIQDYDIVFVAFPIWWGEEPRIIDTFMESYDFSGITMIPFCTSGGSGIGTAESHLHDMTTEETTWLDGSRFAASTSKDEMEEWINSLGVME